MAGLTVDDLLAEIAPREAVARVLLRQELVTRHAELDAELQQALADDARLNRDPLAHDIAAQLVALEAEMEEARRPFRFRAVGQRRWADLLAEHPPTKEQRRDNPRLDHDPATFPIVAIAASCVDPAMTVDQVRQFEERLDVSQWSLLWAACCDANMGVLASPKSLVAGAIVQANSE